MSEQQYTIAIGASFTAQPLEPTVRYWMEELRIPSQTVFAPYGQLLRQLHDRSGLFDGDSDGLNTLLVAVDLLVHGDSKIATGTMRVPQRDLVNAVAAAVGRSSRPWLTVFCPASPEVEEAHGPALARAEAFVAEQLSSLPGVHVVTRGKMRDVYPVRDYFDPATAQLADAPYTEPFFAALATVVARAAAAAIRPPRKVIVLDCDMTLWDGICSEDGWEGIRLDEQRRALQRFMCDQQDAGRLLCICSRNNEQDVRDVFASRDDMLLKPDHIVAWRINWESKSDNLKSLADELQLGLESFIFVDDDPVECADVEANCPAALVVPLPRDGRDLDHFLHHIWAFDHLQVTDEDRRRTQSYREESERERSRHGSATLADFLRDLGLRVDFAPLRDEDLARAAQLTFRTNQMNLTTERRSAAALRVFRETPGNTCLLIRASDRYGEYGTVGLVLTREQPPVLKVDTFLLSCRALGRGVEHQMVAELGSVARSRGLDHVELPYRRSARNAVALAFLRSIGADLESPEGDGLAFRIAAARAAEVTYLPDVEPTPDTPSPTGKRHDRRTIDIGSSPLSESDWQLDVAQRRQDPKDILQAVRRRYSRARPDAAGDFVAAVNPSQEALAAIWRDVLEIESIGVNDNFFEIGGDSLSMTRIIARVRNTLGTDLSFEDFFGAPTIALLAPGLTRLGAGETEGAQEEGPGVRLGTDVDSVRPARPVLVQGGRAESKSAARTSRANISTLCLVTHQRPDLLGRGLASYVANAVKHGRDCRFVVADDTEDPAVAEECRAQIRRVAERHGVAVEYAGMSEKRRLARALISADSIPPQVIDFTLFGVEGLSPSAGKNRNFALLDCVGEAVFMADDDTLCRIAQSPQMSPNVGLAAGRDPAEFRFFPRHEVAIASAAYVDEDLLGLHERLLGRNVADLVEGNETAKIAGEHDLGEQFAARFARDGGRVALTTTGLVGDSGVGAPFGFWIRPMGSLLLDDLSLDRMCADENSYREGCTSRAVHRTVSQPLVTDHSFSMSTFVGIDARSLVPPFLPMMRGEDLVFGTILWKSSTDAFFGHLPYSLVHAPRERRPFWPGEVFRTAAGIDSARLIIDCVRTFEPGDMGHDRADRLRSLGEHLIDLGAQRRADFQEFVRDAVARSTDQFVAAMETALRRRDATPEYWANDVRTYLARLAKARRRPDYVIPLDLRRRRSVDEATDLAQSCVASLGRLLYWWPEVCAVAKDLKKAGRLERDSVS